MSIATLRSAATTLAAAGLVMSVPASALPQTAARSWSQADAAITQVARDHDDDERWEHGDRGRHRGWEKHRRDRYRDAYYGSSYRQPVYYSEPVYANTRVWRGNDGQTYCRKSDGTTGLIIGGAAGALLGRELAGYRGDRTLGAILGAAGGALLGKRLDNGMVCR